MACLLAALVPACTVLGCGMSDSSHQGGTPAHVLAAAGGGQAPSQMAFDALMRVRWPPDAESFAASGCDSILGQNAASPQRAQLLSSLGSSLQAALGELGAAGLAVSAASLDCWRASAAVDESGPALGALVPPSASSQQTARRLLESAPGGRALEAPALVLRVGFLVSLPGGAGPDLAAAVGNVAGGDPATAAVIERKLTEGLQGVVGPSASVQLLKFGAVAADSGPALRPAAPAGTSGPPLAPAPTPPQPPPPQPSPQPAAAPPLPQLSPAPSGTQQARPPPPPGPRPPSPQPSSPLLPPSPQSPSPPPEPILTTSPPPMSPAPPRPLPPASPDARDLPPPVDLLRPSPPPPPAPPSPLPPPVPSVPSPPPSPVPPGLPPSPAPPLTPPPLAPPIAPPASPAPSPMAPPQPPLGPPPTPEPQGQPPAAPAPAAPPSPGLPPSPSPPLPPPPDVFATPSPQPAPDAPEPPPPGSFGQSETGQSGDSEQAGAELQGG